MSQLGKRDLFIDEAFFTSISQLAKMVRKRKITALIAKLYADFMVADKEGTFKQDLPTILN